MLRVVCEKFYMMKFWRATRAPQRVPTSETPAVAIAFLAKLGLMPMPQNRAGARDKPAGAPPRNYMTPQGYARLKAELAQLVENERPELLKVIHWAASNGDRSENGDYIYGKRRLREIERRVRYLIKRLESAVIVDPAERGDSDQIFFGATVTYESADGEEHTVSIVGMDEVDLARGRVSWISPIAKALLRRQAGEVVRFAAPGGIEELEITDVRYDPLP